MTPAAPTVGAYALGLGDDALILAQRLTWWVTRAPELEEEVALANIALDLLGQARVLLSYAGAADGLGEDALAYQRRTEEFRCVHLVERRNGDFAATIARQLAFAAYQHALYTELAASPDQTLAGVAAKAVKEVTYHREHAALWTCRLGDGTAHSRERMQAGLAAMWPDVAELFAPEPVADSLAAAGVVPAPASLRDSWESFVFPVLTEATLAPPEVPAASGGGRSGARTAEFAALHEEMTGLHLAHPGASW